MPEGSTRRCIFCGQAAGSREHALPEWLAIAMGVQDLPVQPGMISTARGVERQGNARAAGKLITKGVCGECNGGWMSELEGQVRPILGPLVTSAFKEWTHEALEPIEENFPVVMRWLLKTAVTLSMVAPQGKLGSLPREAPGWAFRGAVPASCMLYAGWLDHAGFGKALGRGFRILDDGKFHRNQVHEHSFDFRIHLNHLAFRCVNAPGATWGLTSCPDPQGNPCSPRILGRDSGFEGAEEDSILFRNFFEFSKVCVLVAGDLPESLDPDEERKMAESIQRVFP